MEEEQLPVNDKQPEENIPEEIVLPEPVESNDAEQPQIKQSEIPINIGTTNPKPEADMETHAHHLHHAPGKKFWHYFYEFLMLFLAVFCGFLAENWREHFVEKEREKQYMESFVSDLQNDTANLNYGFPLKEQRLDAIDSTFIFFIANPGTKVISGFVFRHMSRATWDRHYRRNSTTIDQLKNAGGLRLVRKKNVADSIASLDLQWTRLEFYRETYMNNQRIAFRMNEQIFNAADLMQKYRANSTGKSMSSAMIDSVQIRIHTEYLNEYLNFLNHQKTNTIQDEQGYQSLERSTERLISLIKKEYHLE